MEFLFCSAVLFAFTSISDCAFHPNHGSQQKGKMPTLPTFGCISGRLYAQINPGLTFVMVLQNSD